MKNSSMNKSLGNLLVTGLGIALLVYSAARSLDFISVTLPPDKQVLAWFGLAALDGGLVFWLLNYMFGAKGGGQRAIALIMVVVDFLGAVAMFTLDTLYRSGEAGLTVAMSPGEIRTAVLGLSMVIAVNVGAVVFHHIADPAVQKNMAQEAANDEIEQQAIEAIQESAPLLAAQLAPKLANDWLEKTRAKYINMIGDSPEVISGRFVKGDIKMTAKRKNGRHAYNSETEAEAQLETKAPEKRIPRA